MQLAIAVDGRREAVDGLGSYRGPIRLVHGYSTASEPANIGAWDRLARRLQGAAAGSSEMAATGGVSE
jgi:hypothetical protein